MRKRERTIVTRSDPKFIEAIRSIQLKRINLGKESVTKPLRPSKITKAFVMHKDFPKIAEDVVREFKND